MVYVLCVCVCVCVLSHVQLFATPWTVAHYTPLSMGFPRQEYWSRLPFPTPEDLPKPKIEPTSLASPALAGRFFITSATWEAHAICCCSVAQLCPTLCDPLDCSSPGFPVFHRLPEFAQAHVCWVSDAIQLSHSLSSCSPPALNLSQHRVLFQWVSSWHQLDKVLEFQLQHQYFQWIFSIDFP